MLQILPLGRGASAPLNPNVRSRPVISGGTVKTDTGQIIRSGAVFSIGSGTSSEAFQPVQWAANRALGLNTMRVGVTSATDSLSLSQLMDNIQLVVDAARNNRMYVMLGYFAAAPGAWDNDVTANTGKWSTFWGYAADRFKDEPHVFFEMVNEPTAWGHVSTYTTAVQQGLRAVFDVMRNYAPETVIVWPSSANLDPSASSYDAMLQAMEGIGSPIDRTKCAVGYHYYNQTMEFAVSGNTSNATDGGRAGLSALRDAGYALLMTETNWWMEPPRDVLIDALDVHEELQIGWTLLRRAGLATASPNPFEGDLFNLPLENKIAQLRERGFVIPIE